MKIFDFFRNFFMKHRPLEAIEAEKQALEKKSEASLQALENYEKMMENLKEPFQLGLAAGYTGRAIKEIESSLHRIESQMVTKDWFASTFEDKTPDLINLLRLHEEEEKKRFEIINNLLTSLQKAAEKAPQPIKTDLLSHIAAIENQLPLTPKMEGLILAVKEFGEISYQDLASKLGISVSGLRGLLTHTLRRTNKIERVIKNGKGWVRYKGD
jgi:superfamily I DNA/RNA helicase